MKINFTHAIQIMKITVVGLLLLSLSSCGVGKHNKIRFVKHQRTSKSISVQEEISNLSNSEASKTEGNTIHGSFESNLPSPTENYSTSTDQEFSFDQKTNQLSGSTYTENQPASFENEYKKNDIENSNEYNDDEIEEEGGGMGPLLYAIILITITLAIILFGILTFLSFSLANGSGIPLLLLTILCITLLIITIKTYNGN